MQQKRDLLQLHRHLPSELTISCPQREVQGLKFTVARYWMEALWKHSKTPPFQPKTPDLKCTALNQ